MTHIARTPVTISTQLVSVFCVLLLGATPMAAQTPWDVAAPAPRGFDRTAAAAATLERLQELVRLDTRNPPGNELLTARWFDSLFATVPGIERHVLEVGEGRANFIARLRATRPTARPVIVMGHMDVVGADSTKWLSPPLEPTIRDGYLYGRGTMDDKGMLAAAATAMVILARDRGRLTRDIIFVATAGEEGGPPIGIDRIVEVHRELLGDAEFALNEGGRIRAEGNRLRTVNIQTAEKIPYNLRLEARGPSGHGSVPIPDNALAALARAVTRLHEWRAPVRLNDITRLYFARLATIEPDPAMRAAMETVGRDGAAAEMVDEAAAVLSREPLHNAVLRAGLSLTLLSGGIRSNVIPSDGSATFNLRVLPGEDVAALVEEIRRVAAEPQVTLSLDRAIEAAPAPSPVTTALYRAMEASALAMAPGAVVIPFLSTGATDGAVLRAQGIPTYGILPFPMVMEDELRMHGDNERIPLPSIGWATEFLYRVLQGVAGR